MLAKLLLICATLTLKAVYSTETHKVRIEQGELEGATLTSRNGRTFVAFQGIPYAEPPVGSLRFKDPVPPKPWRGIWNASLPGSMCLQYNKLTPFADDQDPIVGEEDCLFINVYTPKVPKDKFTHVLDVIVFIHGGAFMYGWSHEYKPHLILDRDAVFVTFNYRLGPLGFLSTEDETVPGNMGLKDQAAALRWIRKNIAAFGGNPQSVTITGNSAGGASVHYHYISPQSRGLFERGYSQSGTTLCPWTQMEQGRAKAKMLGEALGCNTKCSEQLVDCLRNRPARQIVQQVKNFQIWRYNPFSPFGPTVEVAGSNPFLSKTPVDAILQGDVQDLPWITSVTTEDGLYPAADWIANENVMKVLEQRFAELFPHILDYNYTVAEDKKLDVTNRILQHYLQGKPLSIKARKEITRITTDRLFVLEAVRAAKLQAAVNSAPVYFYQFGYRGTHSVTEKFSGTTTNLGVCHVDDLVYVIDYAKGDHVESQEDKNISQLLLDIWTSYAHNGKPVPPNRSFIWEPTTPNDKELEYLYIGNPNKLEMRSSNNLGEQDFWDSLPIKEPQIGKNTPLRKKHTEF